jgi:diphthamide synthase subunit DPH2
MSINYPEDELFICNDNFLCKESHIAKDKNIFTVRTLKRNINSLNSQIEYLYNSRLDKENPWFLRFNDNEKYERITEKEYEQGIKVFNNYKKINYTPLNKFD